MIFLSATICSVELLPLIKPAYSLLKSASVPPTIYLIKTLPNSLATMDMKVIPLQFPQLVKSPFSGSLLTSQGHFNFPCHSVLNSPCRTGKVCRNAILTWGLVLSRCALLISFLVVFPMLMLSFTASVSASSVATLGTGLFRTSMRCSCHLALTFLYSPLPEKHHYK